MNVDDELFVVRDGIENIFEIIDLRKSEFSKLLNKVIGLLNILGEICISVAFINETSFPEFKSD